VRVRVRLFAMARQRVGSPEVVLDWIEPFTVGALKRALAAAYPDLAPIVPSSMIAVAGEYASDDDAIPPGAEVAVIPPVSGGSDDRIEPPHGTY
jgi:molybdopterin converting factor small subunit